MNFSKYQIDIFKYIEETKGNLVVSACAGGGKCLGKDTKILMFNGNIKNIQDIVPGDILMGDDSTPRIVKITSKGYGKLVKVIPQKGDPFICNDVHILTLFKYGVNKKYHSTIDIGVNDLVNLNPSKHQNGNYRNYKLIRTGVNFVSNESLEIDPYFLGLWLGDGHFGEPRITNSDKPIIEYLQSLKFDGYVNTKTVEDLENNTFTHNFTGENGSGKVNYIRNFFKSISDKNEKYIPKKYLISSFENRIKLLSGILDTDGHHSKGNFEIVTVSNQLNLDILFLARSLGFAAYSSKKIGTIKKINFSGVYNRIFISGDFEILPSLIHDVKKRKQIKSVLRTGFKIEEIGYGDYYGIVIDGNHRFILSDFTVTHNTTTLLECIKRIPKAGKRILCIAFNKAIAETLKTKITYSNINIKTFHALGLSILGKHTNGATMDDRKVVTHLKNYFVRENINPPSEHKMKVSNDIKKIIDGLRMDLIEDPTNEDVYNVCVKYDIEFELPEEVDWAIKIYKGVINDLKTYDFVDMLFLPIYHKMKFPKYDFVFIDEVQDMSVIQRKLFEESLSATGRFLAVGDPNQSIYGFAGADANSYNEVCNLPNTKQLPLSISYRCGKKIIKHAQTIVPSIEHWESSGEGEVIFEGSVNNIQDGDVVLCRLCFPVVKLASKFLKESRKVQIKGADIGKNLIKMIEKTKAHSLVEMENGFNQLKRKLVDELKKKNEYINAMETSAYRSLDEKVSIIRVLSEGCSNTSSLIRKIESIFSDDDNKLGITLSTIHKFKGLEANNVFIIEPDMIPCPFYLDRPGVIEQERNLEYVAITRAIHKLEYVTDWTAYDKKFKKRPSDDEVNKAFEEEKSNVLKELKKDYFENLD